MTLLRARLLALGLVVGAVVAIAPTASSAPADRDVALPLDSFSGMVYSAETGRLFVTPGRSYVPGPAATAPPSQVLVYNTAGDLVGTLPVRAPGGLALTPDGRTLYVGGQLPTRHAVVYGFDAATLATRTVTVLQAEVQFAPWTLSAVAGRVLLELDLNQPYPRRPLVSIDPSLPVAVPLELPWDDSLGVGGLAASGDQAATVAVYSAVYPSRIATFRFDGLFWKQVAAVRDDFPVFGIGLSRDGRQAWVSGPREPNSDPDLARALTRYDMSGAAPRPPLTALTGYSASNLALDEAGGAVAVITEGSELSVYDAKSGKLRWRVGAPHITPPWRALALDARRGLGFVVYRHHGDGRFHLRVASLS